MTIDTQAQEYAKRYAGDTITYRAGLENGFIAGATRVVTPAEVEEAANAISEVMEALLTNDECRTYARAVIRSLGMSLPDEGTK